eukprot:218619_1
MGNAKSKDKTYPSKCNCRKKYEHHKKHCCLLECFSQINNFKQMDHLYWIIPMHIKKPLKKALKKYNAEYIVDIIIQYLPSLPYTKTTTMPKKSKTKNNEFIIYEGISCNIYMHANVSWIYNKTKPPCAIWCSNNERKYKLCIMGATGVGKTSLVIRNIHNEFLDEYDPTISDYYRKLVVVNPNIKHMDKCHGSNTSKYKSQECYFDFIDMAGQEEFESMIDEVIRHCDIFFICFAINDYQSFVHAQSLIKRVLDVRELSDKYEKNRNKRHDDKNFAMILVATKCDLFNQRKVSTNDGLQLAKEWNIPYFETSSKEDVNVHFMFKQSIFEYWVETQTYNAPDLWTNWTDYANFQS